MEKGFNLKNLSSLGKNFIFWTNTSSFVMLPHRWCQVFFNLSAFVISLHQPSKRLVSFPRLYNTGFD
jgi:hypothetical protein